MPKTCCLTCETGLNLWFYGIRSSFRFAVPMLWKKPSNHDNDCYFCLTNVFGFSTKNKNKITYPDCPSATKPVSHGEGLPIPVSPNKKVETDEEMNEKENIKSTSGNAKMQEINLLCHLFYPTSDDPDYVPDNSREPHFINQEDLNDLVRDLNLNKQRSELLGSRLQQWNLLTKETRITRFRIRHETFSNFFVKEGSMCSCRDIDGLMEALGCTHKPDEWRLFIDGSNASLKAVCTMAMKSLPFRSHTVFY